MTETCGTCRHFHRYQEDQAEGACHAHPPAAVLIGGVQHPITGTMSPHVSGFWGPTHADEVCGEHSPGVAHRRVTQVSAERVAEALAGIETEGNA